MQKHIIIEDIRIDAREEQDIRQAVMAKTGITPEALGAIDIRRQSLDSRNRRKIVFIYSAIVTVEDVSKKITGLYRLYQPEVEKLQPPASVAINDTPFIVGSGPSGLFAALGLIEKGYKPIIIEQGGPIEERDERVKEFSATGRLDASSNIQFGEGGAGAYSDGKLTARGIGPYKEIILDYLVRFGAEDNIRYLARPHLGTDRLRGIILSVRKYLETNGGKIKFHSKLTGLKVKNGRLCGIEINNEPYQTDSLFLCPGLCSDTLYGLLRSSGAALLPKGFAAGFRIEHKRDYIDRLLYGDYAAGGILSGAEYFLTYHDKSSGKACHSFCMCPGGFVVPSSWRENTVLTNGMSNNKRNSEFSNAALVVPVTPESLGTNNIDAILNIRRKWEEKAYQAGGGGYAAPYQKACDFIAGRPTVQETVISYRPGGKNTSLAGIFPGFVETSLRAALKDFDKKMPGFIENGVLIGCETTVSSPVRIVRDETTKEAKGIKGLFVLGEGAGYSGGIISSAIDGYSIRDIILTSPHVGEAGRGGNH